MIDKIYNNLLSGADAEEVQADIESLAPDQREILLCMLSGIADELRAICAGRADEVDRVLMVNGFKPPPQRTAMRGRTCGRAAKWSHAERHQTAVHQADRSRGMRS